VAASQARFAWGLQPLGAATRLLGRVIQRHTIHVHTQHTSPSFTLPSGTLASIDLAAKLLVVSKKKNPFTHLTTLMKTKRVKGAHAIPLHHCELRHEFIRISTVLYLCSTLYRAHSAQGPFSAPIPAPYTLPTYPTTYHRAPTSCEARKATPPCDASDDPRADKGLVSRPTHAGLACAASGVRGAPRALSTHHSKLCSQAGPASSARTPSLRTYVQTRTTPWTLVRTLVGT
jgi:hypothetical protein